MKKEWIGELHRITDFDVAVIGGGPAGSIASIFLRKAGFKVCILEKKRFPRETICGEFLSIEVTDLLSKLGLFNKFLAQNPNSINTFTYSNSMHSEKRPLGFTAYGLRRSKFDNLLLDEAVLNGVYAFNSADVIEIKRSDNSFALKIRNGFEKELTITAAKVIGAYGKQNSLDKYLHRQFSGRQTGLRGAKIHMPAEMFSEFPDNEICILTRPGGYCGINCVDDGLVTLCMLEDSSIPSGTPRESLWNFYSSAPYFINEKKDDIKNYITGAKVYGTGNLFIGLKDLISNGIIMIGDAACVIPPLAGDGIAMAFRSAEIAAALLSDLYDAPDNLLLMRYKKEWRINFAKRLFSAEAAQNLIFTPALNKASGLLIRKIPRLLDYIIKATRGI